MKIEVAPMTVSHSTIETQNSTIESRVCFDLLLGSLQRIRALDAGNRPTCLSPAGTRDSLSLSVDNLFVFLVIFKYFAVPEEQQHRVLFWGILGALILRGIFIGAGVELISRFHWLLYIFGGLLIYSGIRLSLSGGEQVRPEANPIVKALRRWLPITKNYRGGKFFIRNAEENGRLYGTPLLIVLLVIETSDLMFAVDSIPAVLAITLKAFIVYTSNVFAILGLRSMFFAVAGLMKLFRFLHYGLAVILILVGVKMLLGDYFEIPIGVTLGSVALVLVVTIALSIAFPKPADDANK